VAGNQAVTVLSGGNVGIGTTAPVANLQVFGALDVSPFYVQAVSSNTGTNPSTTNALFIDKRGYVGINTYAPNAPLEVEKSINWGSRNDALMRLENTSTYGTATLELAAGRFNGGTDIAMIDFKNTNYTDLEEGEEPTTAARILVESGQNDQSKAYMKLQTNTGGQLVTSLFLDRDGNAGFGDPNGDGSGNNAVYTVDVEGTFRVENSGTTNLLVASNGNVGIGTASPGALFDVYGPTPSIRISDSRSQAWTPGMVIGALEFWSQDTSGTTYLPNVRAQIQAINDNSTSFPNPALVFSLAQGDSETAEYMRIDRGGSIGIGTTNPNSELHVYASSGDNEVTIESIAATTDARMNLIGNSTGVSQIRFGDEDVENVGLLTYDHADNSISIRTNSSDQVKINSNGNVGIGTTAPKAELEVNGTVSANAYITAGADYAEYFERLV